MRQAPPSTRPKTNSRRYRGHTPASTVRVIDARTGTVTTQPAYTPAQTRRIVGRGGRGARPPPALNTSQLGTNAERHRD